MKKIITLIISIVFLIMIVNTSVFAINGYSSYLSLSESNRIEALVSNTLKVDKYDTEIIHGMKELNKFVLIEGKEKGYLIYDRSLKNYVEYATDGKSPYEGVDGTKIYVAPTYYYSGNENGIFATQYGEKLTDEMIDHLASLEKDIESNYSVSLKSIQSNDYTLPATGEIPCKFYMEELSDNMGLTTLGGGKGCCGFVAITTILSYYDSYLNDEIVPEEYDNEVTLEENDVIEGYYNPPGIKLSFQRMLMDYAMDNGIIKGDYGMTIKEAGEILESYLVDTRGLPIKVARCDTVAKCKEAIFSEHPVWIGIEGSDPIITAEWISHAVVGYAYDETGIIANFGDSGFHPAVHINNYTIFGALYLQMFMEHTHTFNYHRVDGDRCLIGICMKDGYTKQHDNCIYTDINPRTHTRSCMSCGYKGVESHRYAERKSILDKFICTECGYVSDFGYIDSIGDEVE